MLLESAPCWSDCELLYPNNVMVSLKLVTWNVHGLRAKPKPVALLSHLKSMRMDVSVLVETHHRADANFAKKALG